MNIFGIMCNALQNSTNPNKTAALIIFSIEQTLDLYEDPTEIQDHHNNGILEKELSEFWFQLPSKSTPKVLKKRIPLL